MELNTAQSIQQVVQFFVKFYDEKGYGLPIISSDVGTLAHCGQWYLDHPYDVIFSQFQYLYRRCSFTRGELFGRDEILHVKQNGQLSGIEVGTLKKPNISLLKSVAQYSYSSVWEIYGYNTDSSIHFDALSTYASILQVVHKLSFQIEKIVIIESGGQLQLEQDDEERMIFSLPTVFTGGELQMEDQTTIQLPPYKYNWIAGKFAKNHLPVVGGAQVLIIGLISMDCSENACLSEVTQKYDSSIKVGSRIMDLDKSARKAIATIEMCLQESETIGLLLSNLYNNVADYNFEMLNKMDANLVKGLRESGFSVKLQQVLFSRQTSERISFDCYNDVYYWSTDFLLNRKPNSFTLVPQICFFDLGEYQQPIYSRSFQDWDDQGHFGEAGNNWYYILPALIIEAPTSWSRARLLWIAKKKNEPEECGLAILPHDVIRFICGLIRAAKHKDRKRKREEDEDEDEDEEDEDEEDKENVF